MARQISFLLILAGLTGVDSITTVSKISVKTGSSVSIPCLYASQYTHHVKYLCKGYNWNRCSYALKSNQKNSSKYSIFDDKEQRIFTVTIKDLTHTDSYYWCVVEINAGGDIGKFIHLSVTSGTPSLFVDNQFKASEGENITIKCSHNNSGQNKWCRLGGSCITKSSGSLGGTSVIINGSKSFFTVTMSGLRPENSNWYLCTRGDFQMPVHLNVTEEHVTSNTINNKTSTIPNAHQSAVSQPIIITFSVLILLVIMTLFIWFLVKRYEKRKVPSTAAADEEEVTYTVVSHKRKRPSKVEAKDEDVVYSSLSQPQQNL